DGRAVQDRGCGAATAAAAAAAGRERERAGAQPWQAMAWKTLVRSRLHADEFRDVEAQGRRGSADRAGSGARRSRAAAPCGAASGPLGPPVGVRAARS